jgi:FAD/FMN-containing dehydrogenase
MVPEDASRWESFYVDVSKTLFQMGAYFSRPYGPWSDIVYGRYETFVKYARELKRIFDPNLILNPGKLCFREM